MAAAPDGYDAQITHRRETLLWIILPVALGALLIAAGTTTAMLLPRRIQVSVLADVLFTSLVLCPIVLCLLPLCVALVTAVFWMNRVHRSAARTLGRVEDMSRSLSDKAIQGMDTVSRASIAVNSKFAYLNRLWGVFDRKGDGNGKSDT